MVSRDTKLGIVGIALLLTIFTLAQSTGIGVAFAKYESRQASYEGHLVGELKTWPAKEADGVAGGCIPPVCQPRPAFADLSLRVRGLPALGAGMAYHVWLNDEGNNESLFMGVLEAEGQLHMLDANRTGADARALSDLEIFLASGPDASDVEVLVHRDVLGVREGEQPEPVRFDHEGRARSQPIGWSCCESSGGMELTVINPRIEQGLMFCAWLLQEPWGPHELDAGQDRIVPAEAPSRAPKQAGCTNTERPVWSWSSDELKDASATVVTLEANALTQPDAPQGFALLYNRVWWER